MMTLAIELHDIAVQYHLPHERLSGIKEYAIRWAQGRLRYHQFWALRGVDLMIERGESFGVIGRNGAGKSTLLKVMARVLKPTEGRVVMRGRTAPLLELGAGFHPELTGRENVYLNGALIGLPRREIAANFDAIVDFAEIAEFIDAPIRTYSTGMVARLGFAVATNIRPQILLIDEVLSVGDAVFQEKCLARMRAFQSQGTTIVLVSHSMGRVQEFCQRALCLEGGQVAAQGGVNEIVERYSSVDLVIR